MAQPSIGYACGRVGALSKQLLKRTQLERLLSAHTFEEANKALLDIGFSSGENDDFQTVADAHVESACKLLREISPNPTLTDCFLIRYDIHNLKVLLKSRQLGVKPSFLSNCGTLSLDMLRHSVSERRYGQLPRVLNKALSALENQLAKQFDPMLVDAMLDQAMIESVFETLNNVGSKTALRYFTAKVDMQNTIMLLRVRGMNKDFSLFEKVFLPKGSISLRTFSLAYTDSSKLGDLLRAYGEKIDHCLKTCVQDYKNLPVLEALSDDYLYQLYAGVRYSVDSIDVLIRYLLTKQREAIDIRLIMTSKLNGFEQADVLERVREING